MGIFGRISDIFKAEINPDAPEPDVAPPTLLTLHSVYEDTQRAVQALACATLQTRRIKIVYLNRLTEFLHRYSQESSDAQPVDYEYFVNSEDINTYKIMIQQARRTQDKVAQQYQQIIKQYNAVVEKLGLDADTLNKNTIYRFGEFLNFEVISTFNNELQTDHFAR